jgi:hypothetical protein
LSLATLEPKHAVDRAAREAAAQLPVDVLFKEDARIRQLDDRLEIAIVDGLELDGVGDAVKDALRLAISGHAVEHKSVLLPRNCR